VRVDGGDEIASSFDPVTIEGVMDLGLTEGSLRDLTVDQVAVSEDYAEGHDLGLGAPVEVVYPDGAVEQPTVGAVYAEEELVGSIVLHRDAFTPHSAQPSDYVVMVALADGVSEADGELAVQQVADRFAAPDVQTGAEYSDAVAGEIDQVLTVVYVLLILAIVIALMGIANTLALSIHERTRELGLLRAVGQSRRQLRAMVRGEALTVALFGTVGGVGLGLFLGWATVDTLADEGFTAFAVPTGSLAVVLVLGALVGVVAAVRPARRAARLDVLEAIATD
jgi:putative ABC transport system permease protein